MSGWRYLLLRGVLEIFWAVSQSRISDLRSEQKGEASKREDKPFLRAAFLRAQVFFGAIGAGGPKGFVTRAPNFGVRPQRSSPVN